MESPSESGSEPSQKRFPNLIDAHQALIHYMANLGRQNKANPHAIPSGVGLTGLELTPYVTSETVSTTQKSKGKGFYFRRCCQAIHDGLAWKRLEPL